MGAQGPQPAHAPGPAAGPALSTQIVGWRLLERGQKAGQGGMGKPPGGMAIRGALRGPGQESAGLFTLSLRVGNRQTLFF